MIRFIDCLYNRLFLTLLDKDLHSKNIDDISSQDFDSFIIEPEFKNFVLNLDENTASKKFTIKYQNKTYQSTMICSKNSENYSLFCVLDGTKSIMNNNINFYIAINKSVVDSFVIFDNNEKRAFTFMPINGKSFNITFNNGIEDLNKAQIHSNDIDCFKKIFNDFDLKKTFTEIQFRSELYTEEYHWYQIDFYQDKNDFNIYFGRIKNIDKEMLEKENIIRKSLQDPLTKVLQKEAISTAIRQYIESKPSSNCSLFLFDIDYFKSCNDGYGHLFGDKVIKVVAQRIKKYLNNKGLIGRIGGDEFLLLVYNCGTWDEVKKVARDIREIFSNITFEDVKSFRLTCTIGISTYPKDGPDYDTLFKKCDKALYRGKIKGRDCHIIYDEKKHSKIDLAQKAMISNKENGFNEISMSRLITGTLKQLLRAVDMKETVQEVINNIATYKGLDRILVRIRNKSKLYNWDYFMEPSFSNGSEKFTIKELSKYYDIFNSDDAFYSYCNNSINVDNNFYQFLNGYGSCATVIIKLNEGKDFEGAIAFEMVTQKRTWLMDEVVNFTILAKLIGSFVLKDITNKYFMDMANIDNVTSCWNMNGLINYAGSLIKKYENKYSIATFDVLDFHFINEKYGYDVGDKILIYIASAIDESRFPGEYYARLSDDKFAFLIVETSPDTIRKRINVLLKKMSSFTYKGKKIKLKYASGAYVYKPNDLLIEGIDRANKARQLAKISRKNCLFIYDKNLEPH